MDRDDHVVLVERRRYTIRCLSSVVCSCGEKANDRSGVFNGVRGFTVTRKLRRRLSMSRIITALKYNSVSQSGSSQGNGSSV